MPLTAKVADFDINARTYKSEPQPVGLAELSQTGCPAVVGFVLVCVESRLEILE